MCQKRDVELCVPISAGVTYRVRKCNVLSLIRYSVPEPYVSRSYENLQAIHSNGNLTYCRTGALRDVAKWPTPNTPGAALLRRGGAKVSYALGCRRARQAKTR